DVLHSDSVIQPPTVPGPPVAVVHPVPVSPVPDNAHSTSMELPRAASEQLSQANEVAQAVRAAAARAGDGAGSPDRDGSAGPHSLDSGDGHSETFAEWMSSALRREGLTQEAA